jgi:hypothetical protein
MRSRASFHIAVLTALVGAAPPQVPENLPKFSVSANVVTVDVLATDAKGAPIPFLQIKDFVITDEGESRAAHAVDYETSPLDMVLALDWSGVQPRISYTGWPARVRELLRSRRDQDRVGILSFGSREEIHTPLSHDRETIEEGIRQAFRSRVKARPSSPRILDALKSGLQLFTPSGPELRRRVIVLMTHNRERADGDARAHVSDLFLRKSVTLQVLVIPYYATPPVHHGPFPGRPRPNAPPDVIISERGKPLPPNTLRPAPDFGAADSIAEATGGEVFRVAAGAEPDWPWVFERISRRYLVSFSVPDSALGSGRRRIQIALSPEAQKRHPGATVRHPGHYQTPGAAK